MSKAVHHYDVAEWADYVRNQVQPEQSGEMLGHLQSGCPRCKEVVGQLAKLTAVCVRERAYDVPEYVERSVKAFFALNRQPKVSALRRVLATLVYDSSNDPQPAGVRMGHQISRHVLFDAGDYSVDLRFEHEKGSASMVLVGQIANRKAPEDMISHFPVILLSGNQELGRSLSNSFGEFQLEYTPREELHLLVPLGMKGQELEVVLNDRAVN
jgi:hypothetical protein